MQRPGANDATWRATAAMLADVFRLPATILPVPGGVISAVRRLLRVIRAAGLPEPQKQHEVYASRGRLLTRADFAYLTPKRILIYADGLEFHSGLRQRIHDTRQSNQLQTEGWQVLRFLGPHMHRNSTDSVIQLQNALGLQNS
jgi:hypothetical protein